MARLRRGILASRRVTVGAPVSGYGPKADYAKPAGAIDVTVGSLSQALLNGQPNGTKFWLLAGAVPFATPHRITSALTLGSRELHFQFGAVLSGSKELTGWTSDGAGRWFVTGQTQRMPTGGTGHAEDATNYPRYDRGDDLFRDKVPLRHVASLAACVSGTYFFDYTTDRVYVADDPAGHLLEIANCDTAFAGGTNTVLRNGVIEGFGTAAQNAAVVNSGLTQDCLIQLCHGIGISHGNGGEVAYCKIHMIGQLGVAGNGFNKKFHHNEVCHCNYARIDPGWEAGGSKWATPTATEAQTAWVFSGGSTVPDNVVGSTGLHAHDNHFHDCRGPGMWADIDNFHVLVEDNLAERCSRSGLFHEISGTSIWRDNTARENGIGNDTGISFDEFEGAVGPDPVRWESNGVGAVAHNNSELQIVSGAASTTILRSTRGSMTNQELRVRVRRAALQPSFWLVLRGDNNISPLANGYILQLTYSNGVSGFLYKRVGGAQTFLDTVGTNAFNADAVVWVRFQVEGTTLRIRWWEEGTAQPTAWTKVLTDSAVAAGAVRIESEGGATDTRIASVRIDDLNRTTGIFWADRSNIVMSQVQNTWVLNNTTRDSYGAEISLIEADAPYVLQNVTVKGNDVTNSQTISGGDGLVTIYQRVGGTDTSTGLVWEGNHYHVPSLSQTRWNYQFTEFTWAAWQASGRDTTASGGTADTNL